MTFSEQEAKFADLLAGGEHLQVWHACRKDIHMTECVGELAVVSLDYPRVVTYPDGFVMELYPLKEDIQETPSGAVAVRLSAAASYPHSVAKT